MKLGVFGVFLCTFNNLGSRHICVRFLSTTWAHQPWFSSEQLWLLVATAEVWPAGCWHSFLGGGGGGWPVDPCWDSVHSRLHLSHCVSSCPRCTWLHGIGRCQGHCGRLTKVACPSVELWGTWICIVQGEIDSHASLHSPSWTHALSAGPVNSLTSQVGLGCILLKVMVDDL